jgi:hypothetical protein
MVILWSSILLLFGVLSLVIYVQATDWEDSPIRVARDVSGLSIPVNAHVTDFVYSVSGPFNSDLWARVEIQLGPRDRDTLWREAKRKHWILVTKESTYDGRIPAGICDELTLGVPTLYRFEGDRQEIPSWYRVAGLEATGRLIVEATD